MRVIVYVAVDRTDGTKVPLEERYADLDVIPRIGETVEFKANLDIAGIDHDVMVEATVDEVVHSFSFIAKPIWIGTTGGRLHGSDLDETETSVVEAAGWVVKR